MYSQPSRTLLIDLAQIKSIRCTPLNLGCDFLDPDEDASLFTPVTVPVTPAEATSHGVGTARPDTKRPALRSSQHARRVWMLNLPKGSSKESARVFWRGLLGSVLLLIKYVPFLAE